MILGALDLCYIWDVRWMAFKPLTFHVLPIFNGVYTFIFKRIYQFSHSILPVKWMPSICVTIRKLINSGIINLVSQIETLKCQVIYGRRWIQIWAHIHLIIFVFHIVNWLPRSWKVAWQAIFALLEQQERKITENRFIVTTKKWNW